MKLHHIKPLLTLLLGSLLLTACPPDPVDTTGLLSGIVHDALDYSPLQGATVTLSPTGLSSVTGADGRYLFTGVEQGTYTVSVSKANYQTNNKTAAVQAGQTTPLDFTLQRAASALEVSPLTLDFGPNDSQLALNIKNTGQGTMTWQITENTTWLTCTPASGSVLAGQTGSVAVSVSRTGLSAGRYENTLVVTSGDGGTATVRYTMEVSASSGGGLPTVNMLGVDGVTDIAATFSATLPSIGTSRVTAHGFCIATTPQPTLEQGRRFDLGATSAPKETFSYNVADLTPNTTYYVRAFATNASGTVYGNDQKQFTTTATPQRPQVETGAATQVTATTATVGGNILALGHETGITEYGHAWSSEVKLPTTDYEHTALGNKKETGSYTSKLTALKPGTLYYVRAYARNQYGTSYGDTEQFTTAVGAVQLTTASATDIIHNEATCGGRITDLQGNTLQERGVCWGTAANPTLANSHKASTDKTDNFQVRITGLTEKTTYHVRAYATAATGETYYGQDELFTTTHEIHLPTLSATTVGGITFRSATFASEVTSRGNGTLKRTGFVYATTKKPTTKNYLLDCGTTSVLHATTTALAPETTYYVRAFAENEAGISYSEEVSFTTSAKSEGSTDIEREEWNSDENWN